MKTIELRSDTVIAPTKQMMESIATSSYGDWNYGQDKTVKELEKYASDLFGVQDAAFNPTTTFGNQCALLTAGKPGEELIIRDESHIIAHENGSPGRIARLLTKTISNPFGYITPEELKKHIRKKKDHQAPKNGILCLEYPTFEGIIPPISEFHECGKIAKEAGMHVHVDAARIFTGLAESKVDPKEIMKYADTMAICLSKGLLAPLGSVVLGKSKEVMTRFKANRKMMGGVLRKPGVVAGAALISLKKMRLQIWKDNQMARTLGKRMVELGWISLTRKVQTNMIYFEFTEKSIDAEDLRQFLFENKVCTWIKEGTNRFVIHHHIRQEEIQTVISLMKQWKQKEGKVKEAIERREQIEEKSKDKP